MPHAGDITKLSGRELAPADIITFGSPCQGLSIAGQRRGLADERSGLFTEAVRIIREMQEVTNGRYPQIAVWENVPGALSSAGYESSSYYLQHREYLIWRISAKEKRCNLKKDYNAS
jgi:DNA (cytosine-5)-methyltransferase 1